MGWGDEILVTGQAREMQRTDPRPVIVYDRNDRPRWHPLWEDNPRIVKSGKLRRCQKLINGPGIRPYIDYERMKRDYEKVCPGRPFTTKKKHPHLPYRFNDWKYPRGELYFVRKGEPKYVIIEPHNKAVNPNRDWGWDRWQKVVDALDIPWMQINPIGYRVLNGVRHKAAGSFLDACKLISRAQLYVGPEGGLYHAAAALRVPSVAIFGGFVNPAFQGYDDSINLYEPEGSPCGQRVPCPHCRRALDKITPEIVIQSIERMMSASDLPLVGSAIASG